MKNLQYLINELNLVLIKGVSNINISSIAFDSRKVEQDTLFVAVKGTQVDGHIFIKEAVNKGAVAVICEYLDENIELDKDICVIQVRNSSEALGIVASNFYDNPSDKLTLVGITGTNGKTTIATLLYELFTLLGHKSGLFSTISNYIGEKKIAATHTTADSLQINKLLNEMVDNGCKYCFMEVSSHSIVQNRIAGLHFAGGIFTNITQDHLDYHKTFAEYIKAKKLFFDKLEESAFSLTNIDDKNGLVMLQNTKSSKYSYSLKSFSDFKCKILEMHFHCTLLQIEKQDIWTKFIGEFNAYNLLAVYSTAVLLEQDKLEILRNLSMLSAPEGRFYSIKSTNNITVIIDYAHTHDALENILRTINQIRNDNQTIITIIGAGGDRDKGKRPIMGSVAANISDKVIFTSDNPRSENPQDIANEMKKDIDKKHEMKILTILDRREAIKTAFSIAKEGDIILLAGKGHEKYQEIQGVKHHFDDKEEVEKIIVNL